MSRTRMAMLVKGSAAVLMIAAVFAVAFFPTVHRGSAPAMGQENKDALKKADPKEQRAQDNTMETRLQQLKDILQNAEDHDTADAALDLLWLETTANMRVLPTGKEGKEETQEADKKLTEMEQAAAKALDEFIKKGKVPQAHSKALDLKLLIEQQSEVARAVGQITRELGEGDRVPEHLMPLLDEMTGHELHGEGRAEDADRKDQPRPRAAAVPRIIRLGFAVKLRGPFVPPYIRHAEEDVRVTQPIPDGQCVVVFKETRGLMLRLVFLRMTVVADPWATPMLARGTLIPVFALQWVPAEYVKQFNICNKGGTIHTTVTQRVKQDIPLNYFWRFYRKDR